MEEQKSKSLAACKSCKKEVAKSAKKCPHCGETLKTGLFVKVLTGLLILGVLSVVLSPSDEELLSTLNNAEISQLSPSGELYEAFSIMSEYTDVQRENLEKELIGNTVQWQLPVYEVSKTSEGQYRIQTSINRTVGTFLKLYTQSPEEVEFVEGLKEDDLINFKGTISGTFLRNIELDPAILKL